jgi:hypothetical protein
MVNKWENGLTSGRVDLPVGEWIYQ